MELFKDLLLIETQRRSKMELDNATRVISSVYNEWKVKKRRKNAVDLITTSVNKLHHVHPTMVDLLNPEIKRKLATILMRCMDNPIWKPVDVKSKIYRKIYPLIERLQSFNPETGTGGNLKEIIMTRLSACLCYQEECDPSERVFVAYEPKLATKYIKYLFGDAMPCKTYRLQALMLPDEFDTLIDVLRINQEKCRKRFSDCQ